MKGTSHHQPRNRIAEYRYYLLLKASQIIFHVQIGIGCVAATPRPYIFAHYLQCSVQKMIDLFQHLRSLLKVPNFNQILSMAARMIIVVILCASVWMLFLRSGCCRPKCICTYLQQVMLTNICNESSQSGILACPECKADIHCEMPYWIDYLLAHPGPIREDVFELARLLLIKKVNENLPTERYVIFVKERPGPILLATLELTSY